MRPPLRVDINWDLGRWHVRGPMRKDRADAQADLQALIDERDEAFALLGVSEMNQWANNICGDDEYNRRRDALLGGSDE